MMFMIKFHWLAYIAVSFVLRRRNDTLACVLMLSVG